MACQWNANTYPQNQRNATGSGTMTGNSGVMQPGEMQRQTPVCQMGNLRTRTGINPMQGSMQGSMTGGGMPLVPPNSADTPSTVQSPYYTAGFLRNFLGCNMRVEFLIGTSGALVDRVGVLMEVGASYIVLQPIMSDDLLMCDLYSIKFVTIYG